MCLPSGTFFIVIILQRGSHLMIWSDNDVANDFTTLKTEEGEQVSQGQ